MIHIKRFIDKISVMESKQNKDLVLPMTEARGLRDEISKLLADRYQQAKDEHAKDKTEEVIKVEITGGSFK